MTTITTQAGTSIFFKDWGPRDARPIVFHHGWPLRGWDIVDVTTFHTDPVKQFGTIMTLKSDGFALASAET